MIWHRCLTTKLLLARHYAARTATNTGTPLVPAVWARFKAWDPVELIATHAEALRRLALVYLDAGTRDEWGLDLAARIMAARLRALGVAVEHEEFDDGHRATAYRYEVSLPKLAAALLAPSSAHGGP